MVPGSLPPPKAPKFPQNPRAGGRGARAGQPGPKSAVLLRPPPHPPRGDRSWPMAALPQQLAFSPPRGRSPTPALLSQPLASWLGSGARVWLNAERRASARNLALLRPCLPGVSSASLLTSVFPREGALDPEDETSVSLELPLKGNRWGNRPNRTSYGSCESGRTQLGRAAGAGDPAAPETCSSPCLTLSLSLSCLLRPKLASAGTFRALKEPLAFLRALELVSSSVCAGRGPSRPTIG